MKLRPKNNASKRTKDRIKQHSPFISISTPRKVFAMDNRLCILCRSKNWFGWIPINEVEYVS